MTRTFERAPTTNEWDGDEVLQIYPHTFNEARAEGEAYRGQGNLRGIIEKVDFIKDMGFDAIWISPFYPSPMKDGGYDISDYNDVDKNLGTLEDFDKLIAVFHAHDIKVMIDLVPNHTSDEHEWFKESRASRNNPKSDWYIWHDGIPNSDPSKRPLPPNNWSSVFSFPNLRARERGELIVPEGENTPPVSAWQWDETRQQYYLRDFDKSQPNLNWDNPDVIEAVKDVARFWFDRGADGVRVDVANHPAKNTNGFPDEKPNPNYKEGIDNPHDSVEFFNSLGYMPKLIPYLTELTSVLREYPDQERRTMILECWMSPEDLRRIDRIAPDIASTFNFTRLRASWTVQDQQRPLFEYHADLPDRLDPNQVWTSHDVPGLVTRFGTAAARAAAVLNHSLPGKIFTFQKELGGFADADVPVDLRRDDDLGERDGVRTPMRWSGERNGGFSEADERKLWLPADPGYKEDNLEIQAQDPDSSLSLYRDLIHLRNNNEVLKKGTFVPLEADHEDVIAFGRHYKGELAITLINFSDHLVTTRLVEMQHFIGRVVISSVTSSPNQIIDSDQPIRLEPNEAIIAIKVAP